MIFCGSDLFGLDQISASARFAHHKKHDSAIRELKAALRRACVIVQRNADKERRSGLVVRFVVRIHVNQVRFLAPQLGDVCVGVTACRSTTSRGLEGNKHLRQFEVVSPGMALRHTVRAAGHPFRSRLLFPSTLLEPRSFRSK